MLQVVPLEDSHRAGALCLSTAAGWNQLDVDWTRLTALWPGTCFAGLVGGRVVATATVARYGAIGWVGMVLVDEAHRGCGHARTLMRHAMATVTPDVTLGLDATDAGRPVYLKQGFVDHGVVTRWMGQAVVSRDETAPRLTPEDWPSLAALDRAAHGVDRLALLRVLASEPGATARVVRHDNRVTAFGLSRRGRVAAMIGPVVAASRVEAVRVAQALLGDRARDQPGGAVLMDLFGEDEPLLAGFTLQRRLMRMARPAVAGALLSGGMVFAAAGFELG